MQPLAHEVGVAAADGVAGGAVNQHGAGGAGQAGGQGARRGGQAGRVPVQIQWLTLEGLEGWVVVPWWWWS